MEKTNPKQFTSKSKYRTGAHMMISSLDPWDYVSTIFIKERFPQRTTNVFSEIRQRG